MNRFPLFFLPLLLLSSCATSEAEVSSVDHAAWRSSFLYPSQQGRFHFAGTPYPGGLEFAASQGVTMVVDLRRDQELAQDGTPEREVVEALGMKYRHLPVDPSRFGPMTADRFDAIIAEESGPILVHCSTSNRAGGLWATWLARHGGETPQAALDRGRSAGLRAGAMEQAVE
ncbi:MAG: hypothetical protein KDB18_13770, partial [Salinibacterium sp.]|nr:hypothetical protein [Salinibacterium sp.]